MYRSCMHTQTQYAVGLILETCPHVCVKSLHASVGQKRDYGHQCSYGTSLPQGALFPLGLWISINYICIPYTVSDKLIAVSGLYFSTMNCVCTLFSYAWFYTACISHVERWITNYSIRRGVIRVICTQLMVTSPLHITWPASKIHDCTMSVNKVNGL